MCRYHVGATDDATGEDPDAGGGCCGESATHAARLRRIGQHAGRTGSSDHVRLAEQHRKQQQHQPNTISINTLGGKAGTFKAMLIIGVVIGKILLWEDHL